MLKCIVPTNYDDTGDDSNDNNINMIQHKSFSNGLGIGKLNPYYYKAQGVINSSPHDVSITTLVTPNRFHALMRLAHHYQGPISAVLHINNNQSDQLKDVLKQLNQYYYPEQQSDDDHLHDANDFKAAALSLRRFVDIHLLIDDYERQFNMWRNIARMYARTDYILMLDVDFLVSPTIRQILLTLPPKILDRVRQSHAALVIPAFEELEEKEENKKKKKNKKKTTSHHKKKHHSHQHHKRQEINNNDNNNNDNQDHKNYEKGIFFPASKKELIQYVKKRKVDMFHKSWARGHAPTNYTRWYQSAKHDKITDYNYSYEPYVIFKNDPSIPWCDERFIGYGANKAACHFELYISGLVYYVLPDHYVVHQYHPYPEQTRSNERALNRDLYTHFREEVCIKYARSMIARNEWNTKKASNIKRECRKIKEFNHFIHSKE
ncbi:glycosyl-transferase for dystroglycan-domain-containing protein [Cunninghamella echinulata]|nr:glycosyl-transferase for dystroglycan-domain-containing protein [Cunninghamella echinulata]